MSSGAKLILAALVCPSDADWPSVGLASIERIMHVQWESTAGNDQGGSITRFSRSVTDRTVGNGYGGLRGVRTEVDLASGETSVTFYDPATGTIGYPEASFLSPPFAIIGVAEPIGISSQAAFGPVESARRFSEPRLASIASFPESMVESVSISADTTTLVCELGGSEGRSLHYEARIARSTGVVIEKSFRAAFPSQAGIRHRVALDATLQRHSKNAWDLKAQRELFDLADIAYLRRVAPFLARDMLERQGHSFPVEWRWLEKEIDREITLLLSACTEARVDVTAPSFRLIEQTSVFAYTADVGRKAGLDVDAYVGLCRKALASDEGHAVGVRQTMLRLLDVQMERAKAFVYDISDQKAFFLRQELALQKQADGN